MIFVVRWVDFFPTEDDNEKIAICERCWPELKKRYTCVFDDKCVWPAPTVEAGTRIETYCYDCNTSYDCSHGWKELIPLCDKHAGRLFEYVDTENRRRGLS